MKDLDRFNDDWPIFRRPKRSPPPRIDRRHDETYHRIRAELEARELARRQRETAPATSTRPDLAEIPAAELPGE
jgi:hypothetical protein